MARASRSPIRDGMSVPGHLFLLNFALTNRPPRKREAIYLKPGLEKRAGTCSSSVIEPERKGPSRQQYTDMVKTNVLCPFCGAGL